MILPDEATLKPDGIFGKHRMCFADLSLLPTMTTEQVVCFASKEYMPLFAALTGKVRGERIIFYNSATPPSAPTC
jgi:hypothetical protein